MKQTSGNSRRTFIKSLPLGVSLFTGAEQFPDVAAAIKPPKITLRKYDKVLFQGDSITYWHRKLDAAGYNDSDALGSGYALLAASELIYTYPAKELKFFNKGISGNGINDLAARWDTDCLDLKPDVVSILIGVNDYSLKMRENKAGNAAAFRKTYQQLLERTVAALPNVKLIIAEPFAIKGLMFVTDAWFPGFDEYRNVSKELAEKFDAAFIPLQSIFEKAIELAPAAYWCGDGIHPSLAGARLMAGAWLENIRK